MKRHKDQTAWALKINEYWQAILQVTLDMFPKVVYIWCLAVVSVNILKYFPFNEP